MIKIRRDLDLWFSIDGVPIPPNHADRYASGEYNGKESYVDHRGNYPLPIKRAIVDHGATVNVCPRIDSQFFVGGPGPGIAAYQDWLNVGLRPAFSSDDPGTYAIDMFTEMHVTYAMQRGSTARERLNGNPNPPREATCRDMLESATLRGAQNCGLDHKVGTLTPGKEADIVLINTNDVHLYPKHNVITSIVEGAHIGNVDTVFIAGELRKWRGKLTSALLGRNNEKIRQMVDESRDHLFAATKWPLGKIDFSD
jgi:cytosine/adenosine deaminase-related metal-dependent hydrolase